MEAVQSMQGMQGMDHDQINTASSSFASVPLPPPMKLRYVWFDFHHECKQKGKWNNLSKLLRQLEEPFFKHSYFACTSSGQVTSWQEGVIRTNCMDNLDRTNVVQSLFARRSLLVQVGRKDLLEGEDMMTIPFHQFETLFKSVWVNNANEMSRLYAGTGALKVDFTKTGKRTLTGMYNDGVNSCVRYYLNNLTDGRKQDSIDLLLGYYRPDPTTPSPFLPREGQETLTGALNKAFIVLVLIFTFFLLISPRLLSPLLLLGVVGVGGGGISSNIPLPRFLTNRLFVALLLTMLIVCYIFYRVTKTGSKIGERLAVHPQLIPDAAAQKNKAYT
jgi:hypothetical protein